MNGRSRIAGAVLFCVCVCGLGRRSASATVFDISPRAAVGIADYQSDSNQPNATTSPGRVEFETFMLSTGLYYNGSRTANRFSYTFTDTRYLHQPALDSTSHMASISSAMNLSGHTSLVLAANASVFKTTNVSFVNPLSSSDPTAVPITGAATELLSLTASENLAYQASGSDRYLQSLSASYSSSLDSGSTLPQVLQLGVGGRRDRIVGRDTYSLSVLLGEFFRLDESPDPTSAYLNGSVINAQVLAGWRREFSARTTGEIQAGFLALYGLASHSLAISPAAAATLSYRLVPWFATLTVAQAPSINPYAAEALISDSVTVRLSVPLNKRENLVFSSIGGYAYTRRVSAQEHFAVASRVFDVLSVGASLGYLFERVPVTVALDGSIYSLRGSYTPLGSYDNSTRSLIALSVAGAFGFGEGNAGWLRTR